MIARNSSIIIDLPRWITEFPVLPGNKEIAQELIRRGHKKISDISGYLRLVSCDPVLTIHVLKIANTRLFNYSGKISSVEKAVVILGFEQVKDIALSVSMSSLFKPQLYQKHLQSIWRHSLVTALSLKVLAENFNSENKELLYFGGLLHDIGKTVLLSKLGEEYHLLLEKQEQDGIQILDMENQYLGVNHAFIGGELSAHWNLPSNLVAMIGGHHGNSNNDSRFEQGFLNELLSLGNFLAHDLEIGITNYSELTELTTSSKDHISMSNKEYKRIRERILEEIKDQQIFLNHIQIGIS